MHLNAESCKHSFALLRNVKRDSYQSLCRRVDGKSECLHLSLKEEQVWTAEYRSLDQAQENIERYL